MSISCRIADDSFFSSIDTSVNIADHALEFVVEDVLGFTNAFPETKECKHQVPVSYTQKISAFKLFSFSQKIENIYCNNTTVLTYCSLSVYPYNEYLWEINPPPPKFC